MVEKCHFIVTWISLATQESENPLKKLSAFWVYFSITWAFVSFDYFWMDCFSLSIFKSSLYIIAISHSFVLRVQLWFQFPVLLILIIVPCTKTLKIVYSQISFTTLFWELVKGINAVLGWSCSFLDFFVRLLLFLYLNVFI